MILIRNRDELKRHLWNSMDVISRQEVLQRNTSKGTRLEMESLRRTQGILAGLKEAYGLVEAWEEYDRNAEASPRQAKQTRLCEIEGGDVELEGGGGDGAYDLHGQIGPPEAIGKAIGDSLASLDLSTGRESNLDAGRTVYLILRIAVRLEKPNGQA